MNNAVIDASRMSLTTADLFQSQGFNQDEITSLLEKTDQESIKPLQQMKVILHVQEITNDGFNARIGAYAVGKIVVITKPDDPNRILGACVVNTLGECLIKFDPSIAQDLDGLVKFRTIADGYDNGILICNYGMDCKLHAYTVAGLQDINDAIVLVKIVQQDDLMKPFPNKKVHTGSTVHDIHRYLWDCGTVFDVCHIEETTIDKRKACTSDENGSCPLYIDDSEFNWVDLDGTLQGKVDIEASDLDENDSQNIFVKDGLLRVIYLAVSKEGRLDDCTFTSALDYLKTNNTCILKEHILLTAIAGYTATPTVTITPLPSATPTATEIPPTPTITLTPSPTPASGSSKGKPAFESIGVGVLVLVVLLGGGAWLVMRSRKQRKH